jgi:hypothetical protein
LLHQARVDSNPGVQSWWKKPTDTELPSGSLIGRKVPGMFYREVPTDTTSAWLDWC